VAAAGPAAVAGGLGLLVHVQVCHVHLLPLNLSPRGKLVVLLLDLAAGHNHHHYHTHQMPA
jgi:hypothetical protein